MAHKKNPHAVALGKLGGAVGGRAKNPNKGFGSPKMTPERRAEIAKAAAAKRWGREDGK